jgi:alpha-glucosidase (family GH31 glycosyl hydrolase)
MEKYLKLRHRLVPYLSNANIRSDTQDELVIQPMYWNFPDREEVYSVPNQYLFSPNLIIAPITKPRYTQTGLGYVKAWLPLLKRQVEILTGSRI